MMRSLGSDLRVRPMLDSDRAWVFEQVGRDGEAGHYAVAPSDEVRWRIFTEVLSRALDSGEIADGTGLRHRFIARVAITGDTCCGFAFLRVPHCAAAPAEVWMFSIVSTLRHRRLGKRFLDALLGEDEFRARPWIARCHAPSVDMAAMLRHRRFELVATSADGMGLLGRSLGAALKRDLRNALATAP